MWRGVRWLALGAVVATAALVGPSLALADSCGGTSAVSIYQECVPTSTGNTHPNKSSKPSHTATTPYVSHVPPPTHVTVKPHHNNKPHRVVHPHVVHPKHLNKPVLLAAPAHEASVGFPFDLGSGPLLLFALLAGTVLVAIGTGGVRSWRNRHRV